MSGLQLLPSRENQQRGVGGGAWGGVCGGDVFDMGMLIPHCTLWIDIEHMQFTHTNQIFKYTYTIKKYKKLSQHIEVKQPNLIHKQKK